jgi:hypothetical protein
MQEGGNREYYGAQGSAPIWQHKGYVSILSQPICRRPGSNRYVTLCQDRDLVDDTPFLSLKPPKELRSFFDGKTEPGESVKTPCIVGKLICTREDGGEEYYHTANLMVPPGTGKSSELFLADLFIPQMRIADAEGGRALQKGYIMVSDYLGDQELFVPAERMPRELNPHELSGILFQGKIVHTHKTGNGLPLIHVVNNSAYSPRAFSQNAEKLAELNELIRGGEKFWWDYYPAWSESQAADS